MKGINSNRLNLKGVDLKGIKAKPPTFQDLKRWLPSFLTAFLCAFVFTIYVPFVSYQKNVADFPFSGESLLLGQLPAFLIVLAAVAIVLIALNRLVFKRHLYTIAPAGFEVSILHVFLLVVLVLTWLEGFVLSMGLPALTGEADLFSSGPRLIFDLLIWLIVLVTVLLLWRRVAINFVIVSAAIFLVLLFGIADSLVGRSDEDAAYANATRSQVLDHAKLHPQDNALLMVLDATSTSLMQNYLTENPDAWQAFDGFTWFKNNLKSATSTQWAIASILRGEMFDGGSATSYQQDATTAEDSLPVRFGEAGYDVYISSLLPMFNVIDADVVVEGNETGPVYISPVTYGQMYIRFAPYFLKNTISNNVGFEVAANSAAMLPDGNLIALEPIDSPSTDAQAYPALIHMAEAQSSAAPTFQMHHVNGAHKPYVVDRAGGELPEAERFTLSGLIEQSMWTFDRVIELLQVLKEQGLYDSTTIVLLGDHGDRIEDASRTDIRYAREAVLLIKPRNARGELAVSDAPTSNLYIKDFITELHLNGKTLEELTRDLPTTRTYLDSESAIRQIEGIDVPSLKTVQKRAVEQVYDPTVLRARTPYSLSMLGENEHIAYPLSYYNFDFNNGWGLLMEDNRAEVQFLTSRSNQCNLRLLVEVSGEDIMPSPDTPFNLLITDNTAGRVYEFDMVEPRMHIDLNKVQIAENNTLRLGFAANHIGDGNEVRLIDIEIQ